MSAGKQGKRLSAIGWLMLAGVLLLLLFLGQWLSTQYNSQESRLDQEVKMTFALTEARLSDSIFKNEITIILNASDSVSGTDTAIRRSATGMPYRDSSSFYVARFSHEEQTIIKKADRIGQPHVRSGTTIMRVPKSSVNLKISLPEAPAGKPENEVIGQLLRMALKRDFKNNALRSKADSAFWLKTFQTALNEKQSGLAVHWDTAVAASEKRFHYGKADSLDVPFMVTGYKPILARNIAPQAAFCLLLLLLIGGAFMLAYRTMRQQARFNKQKDSFISNISHELKTPVATTKVALEALTTYHGIDDPERAKKYLDVAHWEMNRLTMLIDRVMNVIQVQNGKIQLEQETLRPAVLVAELVQTLQPIFTERKVTVSMEIGNEETTVLGDKIHLQGAIYNLLDNALKYGGDRVWISQAISGKELRLTIADNGPGIAATYHDKIFESFFRIPSGDRHDVKGHGLGLSYASDIVRAHRGNLRLESQPGDGAAFTITLPIHTSL